MGTREELDACLCALLDSENVYFQPPENLRIHYPCIIYQLDDFYEPKADNNDYHRTRRYKLLYITHDPDDVNIEKISDLPFCKMNKPYTAENLHHYPYNIYF